MQLVHISGDSVGYKCKTKAIQNASLQTNGFRALNLIRFEVGRVGKILRNSLHDIITKHREIVMYTTHCNNFLWKMYFQNFVTILFHQLY